MKIAAPTEDGTTISHYSGRAPFYVAITIEIGKVVTQKDRDNSARRSFL